MANFKRNQLNQLLVPMVDKTDFASVESAIVASDITRRFFGVNHGGSAAMTSGAISKVASLVHSGIFRLTLKATECDYDYVLVRLTHASCADQLIRLDMVTNDDSDLLSALTVIQSMASDAASAAIQANSRVLLNQSRISDLTSYLVAMSGLNSDVQSAVAVANSRVLLNLSRISDIASVLSDLQSDFQSRVPKRVATDSQASDLASDLKSAIAAITASVSASDISDIASAVWAHTIGTRVDSRVLVGQSYLSDIRSHVSDLQSDFQSRVPKRTATDSQLSDLASDLKSAIAAITATVSASDISDIASAVWANTIGARVDSRVLLVQSRVSDAQSMLSDFLSDFQSRVPKLVATNSQLSDLASDVKSAVGAITVTLTASDISDIASAVAATAGVLSASEISDIASAVWAHTIGVRVDSRVLVNQSRVSDVYSLLSDLQSDFQSRVPKRVATDSQLSDLHSDLRSYLVALSAVVSDTYSAAGQANSRVLVGQSYLSDIRSHVSDLQSDFQSRVPKRVATDSQLSDLASDVKSAVAAFTASVSASDISDIVSAVWAHAVGTRVDSRVLLNLSRISDVYSVLSDLQSDFQSRVPKRVATDSQLSDLHSDLKSHLAVSSGVQSDIYGLLSDFQSDFGSRVPKRVATESQVSDLASDLKSYLLGLSGIQSDIYSLLSDTHSNLQSQVGALPGTIAAAVFDEPFAGHATAGTYGDKFGAHLKAVLKVVVGAGSTTTTVVLNATTGIDAGVPSNVNDFYSGRVLIFTSGDLAGQGTSITSYDGPTKTLTVVALTSAPVAAVTAVLA